MLLDLFHPPTIRPTGARRVTLVDVETSAEAQHRQRCEALIKARAAIKGPRGRKPPADVDAAKARRAAQRAGYEHARYWRDPEAMRARARERMRELRAKRKGNA